MRPSSNSWPSWPRPTTTLRRRKQKGYRSDEFDEAPYPGRILGPDDGDGSKEAEGLDEPGPYWWRRTTGRRAAPLEAEGGLHTRNRRGQIGETWWSRRFLEAVESALLGGRLARGRAYARRGQVFALDIATGLISASVQGSRPTPYKVRVAMPVVRDEEWERIFVSLASRASYCASMLAGELPHEVEDVFSRSRRNHAALPHVPCHDQLHLPRLGEPLQARRRGLLPRC